MAKLFVSPPADARPWVLWFWINGNVTREGITADLEAMRRVGIGGVLLMEVNGGAPEGPIAFMGPLWHELFRHVITEANRLGLEVNMTNAAGWAGSSGPWIHADQSMKKIVWTETNVEGPLQFSEALPSPEANHGYYRDIAALAFPAVGEFRIPDIQSKALFERRDIHPTAEPELPGETVITQRQTVDLTAQLLTGQHIGLFSEICSADEAHIEWDVPPGKWTILRIGYTTTGATSPTAPTSGGGLECDKLSPEAIDIHFAAMMAKLIADARAVPGRSLVAMHVDSWEAGAQNWTARMREEFQKRRGYDLLRFLPVITGRVVDGSEVSDRFLWDFRQTIAELLVTNYAGRLQKLAHRHGLRLSIEAYDGPFDDMTYAGRADEPMCEFWTAGDVRGLCKEMASAAHTYGKRIVAAEAFTANSNERWLAHPSVIKALGDVRFIEGVNRLVIHRYAMQPRSLLKPGMAMGRFGLHYDRTQTWWEYSLAWHEYLTRTQFLLRQGTFVADICYVRTEATPQGFQSKDRNGYDYDDCTPEIVINRMSVRNGRVCLPGGISYRVLVLPAGMSMTPALIRKIRDLVKAGATVIGPRPQQSPSLEHYPTNDAEVLTVARDLWGNCDGGPVTQHAYGKGKIVCGRTPQEKLAETGVPPDFSAGTGDVRAIHRSVGGTDIYFVANVGQGLFALASAPLETICTFRVTGKRPELWNPETGMITAIKAYDEANGRTSFPIRFSPSGSVFVVFRDTATPAAERVVSVTRDGRELLHTAAEPGDWPAIDLVNGEIRRPGNYAVKMADGRSREWKVSSLPEPLTIDGPWELRFPPSWGAPEHVTLQGLSSWSAHQEPGVRYFSGQATYTNSFRMPREMISRKVRLYLDLGNVQVMAKVTLNGTQLGVLWKSPYRVEVTGAAKAGENLLQIEVVNLWPNRMLGDEQLAEDSAREPDGSLREWPQWVRDGKPSPTGRYTFTTWRLWKKDEPLPQSGLLGPVTLRAALNMNAQ